MKNIIKLIIIAILAIIASLSISSCQNNANIVERAERQEYIIDTTSFPGEDLLVTNSLDTLSDDFEIVSLTFDMLDTLKKCIISQENNKHFVFKLENGWYEYLEVLQNGSEIYVCRWHYLHPLDDVNYVVEKIENVSSKYELIAIDEMYNNRTEKGKKYLEEAFFDINILKNTLFK